VRRRDALAWLAGTLVLPSRAAERANAGARYAQVVPGYRIRFPQDEGAHPLFRTEWWYITGWLEPGREKPIGFQITFFRTRPEAEERNPSAFTPRQIIIGHAALSDARRGRLLHDQKVARAAFGLAGADEERLKVWIDDWSLVQEGADYRTRIAAREFALDLVFMPTQPPLLQGDGGLSRKGPRPESASYYYSQPQLRVGGVLVEGDRRATVAGLAWLDHEWSSSYMDERAVGWDWIGVNFDDGAALMAFRMRDRGGGTFWAGGAFRTKSGERRVFGPGEVEFTVTQNWRSPRTGATYPVRLRVKAGALEVAIEPLMNDQEHDTRASVGTVYWEGAVTALVGGKAAGRGYLELTGYWRPMKL
jgi:predicted secreted hydrolase